MIIKKRSRIVAADEFDIFDEPEGPDEIDALSDGDGVEDQLDDIADTVEDMQDDIDDVVEEDSSIEVDNNIVNHYIAECEKCKGIFISAVVETDIEVDSITGTCPICGKESTQFFRWIIRDIE